MYIEWVLYVYNFTFFFTFTLFYSKKWADSKMYKRRGQVDWRRKRLLREQVDGGRQQNVQTTRTSKLAAKTIAS